MDTSLSVAWDEVPEVAHDVRCTIAAEIGARKSVGSSILFSPLVVVPVVAAFVLVSGWVLFSQGLAAATAQAFGNPALFLAVVVVTVLSAGFHEFGHAAAARYGGSTPGAMGFGIYLFWPAFYTDVTDSYRLGRAGRVRTDLGGLYFNAVVAVAVSFSSSANDFGLSGAVGVAVATNTLALDGKAYMLAVWYAEGADGTYELAPLIELPPAWKKLSWIPTCPLSASPRASLHRSAR